MSTSEPSGPDDRPDRSGVIGRWIAREQVIPVLVIIALPVLAAIGGYALAFAKLETTVETLAGVAGDLESRLEGVDDRLRAVDIHVNRLGAEFDAWRTTVERQIAGIASGTIGVSSPPPATGCHQTTEGHEITNGHEITDGLGRVYLLGPTPTEVRAVWGIGQNLTEVTAQIDALCDGRYPCRTTVDATSFGPDPRPDLPKDLYVTFNCAGEAASILAHVVDTDVLSIRCP